MAGKLTADKDDLDRFAKSASDKHAQLIALIQKVHAAEETTTATWQGSARTAFDNLMMEYYQNAEKLNNQLADTADKLVKSGANYSDQDDQYAKQVQQQAANFSLNLP